jgi:phospholipid-binding lipoprotein MlaA
MQRFNWLLRILGVVLIAGTSLLSGCASTPGDPLQSYNKTMFNINQHVDKAVLKPVAKTYVRVVPHLVQVGVHNFFGNLGEVGSTANDFLQLDLHDGMNGVMRVEVNTVFGLGGLLDPATEMRLYKRPNDFGLTLARWGVGRGPYVVLPLFGPSTLRDAFGTVVQSVYASPLGQVHDIAVRNTMQAMDLVNERADLLQTTNLLDQIALDPYLFTRNAYLQMRSSEVRSVKREGILHAAEAQQPTS